jgi:peptide deformylase
LIALVTIPDPLLHRKAKKVTDFGKDLQVLIDEMTDIMRHQQGTGIAAPQVGESLQLIVVENEDKIYVMANPEIMRSSSETEINPEGCLSVPNVGSKVERSLAVTVRGQDRNGKPIRIKAKGMLARIFQHEIDHINGILIIDVNRSKELWQIKKED